MGLLRRPSVKCFGKSIWQNFHDALLHALFLFFFYFFLNSLSNFRCHENFFDFFSTNLCENFSIFFRKNSRTIFRFFFQKKNSKRFSIFFRFFLKIFSWQNFHDPLLCVLTRSPITFHDLLTCSLGYSRAKLKYQIPC